MSAKLWKVCSNTLTSFDTLFQRHRVSSTLSFNSLLAGLWWIDWWIDSDWSNIHGENRRLTGNVQILWWSNQNCSGEMNQAQARGYTWIFNLFIPSFILPWSLLRLRLSLVCAVCVYMCVCIYISFFTVMFKAFLDHQLFCVIYSRLNNFQPCQKVYYVWTYCVDTVT